MNRRRLQGSAADLPSSHGGGVLPGNQIGRLGSAAARTANDGRAASACLSSILLPRKEDDARCPFLGSAATAVVEDEEAETSAIGRASCGVGERWAVWWAVRGSLRDLAARARRSGAGLSARG